MKHEPLNNTGGKETIEPMNGWRVKYEIFTLAVILFCLIPLAGSGASQQNSHTILIDPAHGGEDAGVMSDKLREKDLTLNLALLVREEAQKAPGLQIQFTRSADRTVSIVERVKAAGTMKADCVISLHVNAGFGKKASGYEFYFPGFRQPSSGGGDSSPILKDMARNKSLNDSVGLAQQIQSGLETVFPRKGRGLRDAPSPLLDGLTIPGLVVEIGFATNPDDRKRLTAEETQRAVARALVKGLRDHFRKTP
jgi:N-acetylmuramoyl-L-alanine amidase